MDRTISWAKRCRTEFDRLTSRTRLDGASQMPKLFAVVQGGGDKVERKRCAEALLEIGFDGYGYGGWPLDAEYSLLDEMLGYVRELIPAEYPLHALGVGHPENVAACARMGYQMFDSALPTRDARRGRLYTFTGPDGLRGEWFQAIYIHDKEHIRAAGPLSDHCDCPTCQTLFARISAAPLQAERPPVLPAGDGAQPALHAPAGRPDASGLWMSRSPR